MKKFRLACTVATALFLTACSDKKPPEPAEKPSGVIPQAQLDTLNKAKAIEDTLMQTDAQRREQADQ